MTVDFITPTEDPLSLQDTPTHQRRELNPAITAFFPTSIPGPFIKLEKGKGPGIG